MDYPVDLIYSAIFRIICGGRDYGGWYYNSRLPIGDLGAFTTRFSEYLHDTGRRWIAERQDEVDVRSAAPLWWREMCFWTHSSDGRKCLQVNLVNPPQAAEVMENPRSEISPGPQHYRHLRALRGRSRRPPICWSASRSISPISSGPLLRLEMHYADEGRWQSACPACCSGRWWFFSVSYQQSALSDQRGR